MGSISIEAAAAVAWAAAQKVAAKELRRELLHSGAAYKTDLSLAGTVAGREVSLAIAGELKVNDDTERATPSAIPPARIVAYLLAELTATRRKKVLQTLPELFEELGGELPEVESSLLAESEALLARLRARKTEQIRGSIVFVRSAA